MKRFCVLIVALTLITFNTTLTKAQGITRSTGLGVRVGFWNITGQPTRIDVNGAQGEVKVDLNGAGAWLYFFSRAHNNLFFEMNLGGVGSVKSEQATITETTVAVEAIVPFLLGLRYDFLGTRLSGAFHPYFSLGGGPYWATSISSTAGVGGPSESVATNLAYGGYLGGGTFLVLTSFFALNFDFKYHFIDFQPDKDYSGLEFGMGLNLMWGRKREAIKVMGTKLIVQDIYPAYYQFYSTYPLAFVTVRNMLGHDLEVNVRCFIRGFTERAKDSGFIKLKRGETKDIPVTVFFSKKFIEVSKRKTAILDLQVEARASTSFKEKLTAEITIHSRNAWNGDMDKLGYFLTPEDEEILQLSRELSNEVSDEYSRARGNLATAEQIFNYLRDNGIKYHPDPNIPFYQDDRVNYATETIQIGSGDCDDLVVLYASLLESAGISTAFVEVRDPQKEIAHLYLMFDSGLSVSQRSLISSNDKRYIIRENSAGQQVIWIPIETTLVEQGFEQAWNAGALAYLQEAFLRNGLVEGWVNIIEHH